MDDQMEYKDLKKTAECGTALLIPSLIFFYYLAVALLWFFIL